MMKPIGLWDRGIITCMAFVFIIGINSVSWIPLPEWIAVILGLINAMLWFRDTGKWRKEDE